VIAKKKARGRSLDGQALLRAVLAGMCLCAWPAITVPYEAILSVEFNPGRAAREREIGFTVTSNL